LVWIQKYGLKDIETNKGNSIHGLS
jgi:hypothetical protein